MLLEVFVLELDEELVGDIDDFVDLDVLLDVLQVLQHHCEIVVDDHLLAGHDDGDGEEVYELQVVV